MGQSQEAGPIGKPDSSKAAIRKDVNVQYIHTGLIGAAPGAPPAAVRPMPIPTVAPASKEEPYQVHTQFKNSTAISKRQPSLASSLCQSKPGSNAASPRNHYHDLKVSSDARADFHAYSNMMKSLADQARPRIDSAQRFGAGTADETLARAASTAGDDHADTGSIKPDEENRPLTDRSLNNESMKIVEDG